jgi:hypothetical protein
LHKQALIIEKERITPKMKNIVVKKKRIGI